MELMFCVEVDSALRLLSRSASSTGSVAKIRSSLLRAGRLAAPCTFLGSETKYVPLVYYYPIKNWIIILSIQRLPYLGLGVCRIRLLDTYPRSSEYGGILRVRQPICHPRSQRGDSGLESIQFLLRIWVRTRAPTAGQRAPLRVRRELSRTRSSLRVRFAGFLVRL
jgi:hypothetical protein